MSRTMFWYIMRDLLRIFLMASGVLAGILSFGGLLKPLMHSGLNSTQVGQMLAYFMPAMQTMSLPFAALFATTLVYGRLSADNELTACRATGMSYFSLSMPAFVLGLVLALVSLASLSFVVPHYMLKVEKVAFSSLADMVQKSIERGRQIKLPGYTIYAESAEVRAAPAQWPEDELVVLHHPMFCLYEQVPDKDGKQRMQPSQFFTASSAAVRIHQAEDHVECLATLADGVRFPREFEGSEAWRGGVGTAQFGPFPLPSPIKENTKFMNIRQLKELYRDPGRSREIRSLLGTIVRQEQEQEFLSLLAQELRSAGECRFERGDGEVFVLSLEERTKRAVLEGKGKLLSRGRSKLTVTAAGELREVRLTHTRNGMLVTADDAREVSVRVQSDLENRRMRLEFDLQDVLVKTAEGEPARASLSRPFNIPLPQELASLETHNPEVYVKKTGLRTPEAQKLRKKFSGLKNEIEAEIHGRASFAVSCLILVMVGCALGMMFRTGNYLTAFALSIIPALLCSALVATGQHVAENGVNSLGLGLGVIWSGNLIALTLAAILLGRLQRQ